MSDQTDEQIEELRAKAERADQLEQQLKDKEEELNKERAKDKNFGKFREAETQKRSKLGMEVDDLKKQIDKEREARQGLMSSVLVEAEENVLSQLAGGDKDLRQKIKDGLKESELYRGPIKSQNDLVERATKVYGYLEGKQKTINPINSFHPMVEQQVSDPESRKKNFANSPEGEALIKAKFPKIAEVMDRLKKK
jgi:hypothetical protein